MTGTAKKQWLRNNVGLHRWVGTHKISALDNVCTDQAPGFTITFDDLAGNPTTVVVMSQKVGVYSSWSPKLSNQTAASIYVDTSKPILKLVSVASDGPDRSRAKAGDVVTVTVNATERLLPKTVKAVFLTQGRSQGKAKTCSSSGTCLDGPYNKYAFSWYMGTQGSTCDQVCSGVGGKNLYDNATNAFKDYCGMSKDRGKDSDDVMNYFYKNGNKGKFKGSLSSGTSYKTLGYGYVGSTAYGKCAVGTAKGAGTIPNESSNSKTRINVCACFGAPDRPA